jgi:hypothetical protein
MEIPVSCTPAHLLQDTKMLYRAVELRAVDARASSTSSFSCVMRPRLDIAGLLKSGFWLAPYRRRLQFPLCFVPI